jgi:hypothetical protein
MLAKNPNAWFEWLKSEKAIGVRLRCMPQNYPSISDRFSAGFVGGGGTWMMEAVRDPDRSSGWVARWEVWDRKAPNQRIWKVAYGPAAEISSGSKPRDGLKAASSKLRAALVEIYSFAQEHEDDGFTACFARALETIDSNGAELHGYHKDLMVAGTAPLLAAWLLDVCQSAWVFGGMGSWNDAGVPAEDREDYDRVSDRLFTSLRETIEIAANATFPGFRVEGCR